jgi:hypothetical protein
MIAGCGRVGFSVRSGRVSARLGDAPTDVFFGHAGKDTARSRRELIFQPDRGDEC